MDDIIMKRNGRKEYTVAAIADILASSKYQMNAPVDEGVEYFLHVDEDGNIVNGWHGYSECFTYLIPIEDYDISEEDIETYGRDDDGNFAWWDSSFIPDRENLDCKAFAECVGSLTDDLNKYLRYI